MNTCDRPFIVMAEDHEDVGTCDRILVTPESMAIAMHDGCAATGNYHEAADCPDAVKNLRYAEHIVGRLKRAG